MFRSQNHFFCINFYLVLSSRSNFLSDQPVGFEIASLTPSILQSELLSLLSIFVWLMSPSLFAVQQLYGHSSILSRSQQYLEHPAWRARQSSRACDCILSREGQTEEAVANNHYSSTHDRSRRHSGSSRRAPTISASSIVRWYKHWTCMIRVSGVNTHIC